jgi:hypothetical protein
MADAGDGESVPSHYTKERLGLNKADPLLKKDLVDAQGRLASASKHLERATEKVCDGPLNRRCCARRQHCLDAALALFVRTSCGDMSLCTIVRRCRTCCMPLTRRRVLFRACVDCHSCSSSPQSCRSIATSASRSGRS